MNKYSKKLIVIAVLSLLVCVGTVMAFLIGESNEIQSFYGQVDDVTQKERETADEDSEQISDYSVDENITVKVNTITGEYNKFIFVGDSRYVGMKFLAGEEDIFLAESGEGFDFLNSNYTREISSKPEQHLHTHSTAKA